MTDTSQPPAQPSPRPDEIKNLGAFIWAVADLLRGDFKAADYGKIILPMTVLARLDAVLAPTKEKVVEAAARIPEAMSDDMRNRLLLGEVGDGIKVYNTSRFTFASLRGQDASDLRTNLLAYIKGFSPNARDIFISKFKLPDILKDLDEKGLLWMVFERFCAVPLHPDQVSNLEMGYAFEELIRKFAETSNETAGEHFTPREVVRLLVGLLLVNDHEALTQPGVIRHVYDPCVATGGMLSITKEEMRALNPGVDVGLFGQELNGESYAICKADMMITGHDPENIAHGNSLTEDAHQNRRFHYMLSNPPYGVKWAKYADKIKDEHARQGSGRFQAGLPRISDGQLLFVQHMVSKMRDDAQGSRIGIVMNGSPLFSGGAGSGESEIRRWLMEEDLVEVIVALPTDLFYNTGIQTYAWILTNRKSPERRGKVQLIDASGERFWSPMRRSLGMKRREIGDAAREEILSIYGDALNGDAGYGEVSKILAASAFGYRRVRVLRPMRKKIVVSEKGLDQLPNEKAWAKRTDAQRAAWSEALVAHLDQDRSWSWIEDWAKGRAQDDKKLGKADAALVKAFRAAFAVNDPEADPVVINGAVAPDADLTDYETVPMGTEIADYMKSEVLPHAPDAWVDETYLDREGGVGVIGYEINFNRYFYRYVPPRPLAEIDAELKASEARIAAMLAEVAG